MHSLLRPHVKPRLHLTAPRQGPSRYYSTGPDSPARFTPLCSSNASIACGIVKLPAQPQDPCSARRDCCCRHPPVALHVANSLTSLAAAQAAVARPSGRGRGSRSSDGSQCMYQRMYRSQSSRSHAVPLTSGQMPACACRTCCPASGEPLTTLQMRVSRQIASCAAAAAQACRVRCTPRSCRRPK